MQTGVGLRWRILHALGRSNEPADLENTCDLLEAAWTDKREANDVRYSACRALIKLSLDHKDRRENMFGRFSSYLSRLRAPAFAEKPGNGDHERRVSRGIWKAMKLADEAFDVDFVRTWDTDRRPVLEEALATAKARGWDTKDIERAIAEIRG